MRKVTAHQGPPLLRIVRVGPSGIKGAPAARRHGDGRKRPPLTPEDVSADPAGLTARARPKARPVWRAANLPVRQSKQVSAPV